MYLRNIEHIKFHWIKNASFKKGFLMQFLYSRNLQDDLPSLISKRSRPDFKLEKIYSKDWKQLLQKTLTLRAERVQQKFLVSTKATKELSLTTAGWYI